MPRSSSPVRARARRARRRSGRAGRRRRRAPRAAARHRPRPSAPSAIPGRPPSAATSIPESSPSIHSSGSPTRAAERRLRPGILVVASRRPRPGTAQRSRAARAPSPAAPRGAPRACARSRKRAAPSGAPLHALDVLELVDLLRDRAPTPTGAAHAGRRRPSRLVPELDRSRSARRAPRSPRARASPRPPGQARSPSSASSGRTRETSRELTSLSGPSETSTSAAAPDRDRVVARRRPAIPIAATTQSVAAVVRPRTRSRGR